MLPRMMMMMKMLRLVGIVAALVVGQSKALVFDGAESDAHDFVETGGTGGFGPRRFGSDDAVSDVPSDMPSDVPSYAPSYADPEEEQEEEEDDDDDDDDNVPSAFPSLILVTPPPVTSSSQDSTISCVAGNSVALTNLTSLPVPIVVTGFADCRATSDGAVLPLTSIWTSSNDSVIEFANVSDVTTTATVSAFGTWSVCLELTCGTPENPQSASCCTEIVVQGSLSEQGESGIDTSPPGTQPPTARPTTVPSMAPVTSGDDDKDPVVIQNPVDFAGQQHGHHDAHGRAEPPTLPPNADYELIRGGGTSQVVKHPTTPTRPHKTTTKGATDPAPHEHYVRLPHDGPSLHSPPLHSPPDRSGLVDSNNNKTHSPISEQGESKGHSSEPDSPEGFRYPRKPQPQGEDTKDQAPPQPDPQTGLRYAGLVHNVLDSQPEHGGDNGEKAPPTPKTKAQTRLRYSRLRSQGKVPPGKKRPDDSAIVDKPEDYIRLDDAGA